MHTFTTVTRPIIVAVNLGILHLTAGIVGKTERLINCKSTDWRIAVINIGISQAIKADKTRSCDYLLPFSFVVLLMHCYIRRVFINTCNNNELLSIVHGIKLSNPRG